MARATWRLGFLPVALAVGLGLFGGSRRAAADDPGALERRERCAVRVAIALTGKSPDAALLRASDPQADVDRLLATPEFVERFARFTNAAFNVKPGATATEDATYWVVKRVLSDDLPWKDTFVGAFDVTAGSDGNVTVVDAPNGLGYFRSLAWQRRYAGNETAGLKLVTAHRILKNVVGVKLSPVTTAPGQDVSATGREAPGCRGCHYDGWFALDRIASVLTRRVGTGEAMMFVEPTGGPQSILDGRTIGNDRELIEALVASPQFAFAQCRLAFNFLYGRDENACEGTVFDACTAALTAEGTMRSALRAIARNTSFCD